MVLQLLITHKMEIPCRFLVRKNTFIKIFLNYCLQVMYCKLGSDGHQSVFSANWILKNTYEGKFELNASDDEAPITTWDAKTIQTLDLEPLVHSEVMNNDTVLVDVYKRVLQYGFVQIAQVPEADTANLFERICRMSRTVFGTFWETGTNFNHKDTGYLNGYLEAHTDNTYFTEAQG